ncbi:hypothetical protein [Paenibacillus sedimenti]|uniref:Uncharacterized protein n=1 Tax=Paenibacillus sedimenti TaxID=2770274 RepID=A0A926KL15_9BACL|nr:hypothetical protein [Paenibacillus sedimenti]MBD0379237.1 hypothetical protein [Paenibacillus sedimenti]
MDNETREGIENLERTVEAADLLPAPEGARGYVDIIGDEKLTSFGNQPSKSEE